MIRCGVCGRRGHTRRDCPYEGVRKQIPGPRSRTCDCCGSSAYDTEAHHTRGRGDPSDSLDLCAGDGGCHLLCGHDGDFQNLGTKPRVCRVTGRPSAWLNEPGICLGGFLLAAVGVGVAVRAYQNRERAREAPHEPLEDRQDERASIALTLNWRANSRSWRANELAGGALERGTSRAATNEHLAFLNPP